MTNLDDEWYYAAGNAQKGPFSIDQMRGLAAAGTIDATTLVWSRTLTGWEPLGRTELQSLLGRRGTVGVESPGASQTFHASGAASGREADVTSFDEAVRAGLTKYATLVGRANRAEFWFFSLFTLIVGIVTGILDLAIFGTTTTVLPLQTIATLALLVPSFAISVRRLHDTDRSGWWLALLLIPIAGPIVLIVFWCLAGTPQPNRYG